jgi:hypothetical protein
MLWYHWSVREPILAPSQNPCTFEIFCKYDNKEDQLKKYHIFLLKVGTHGTIVESQLRSDPSVR